MKSIYDKIDWELEVERYSNKGICCPYCGYTNTESEDIYLEEDGTCQTETCGQCTKKFTVVMNTTFSWTSQPEHPEFNPIQGISSSNL
jgi:hypothetical protein